MHLQFSMPSGAANFALSSKRPAMDVGGRGYIRFSNGFTYYYSLTDIATSGTLTLNGRAYRITGTSWLDHQWGNWTWTGVNGWVWMALQLNNHTQLSVFDVRSPSGATRAASNQLPNGKLRTLHAVSFRRLGTWKSPHTGAVYPSGFVVSIPSLKARLRVLPTVKDQELWLRSQPQGSYWEGSATISGTWQGKPTSGLAYTELTGYAH
jgi:predicted secreted hydrolase